MTPRWSAVPYGACAARHSYAFHGTREAHAREAQRFNALQNM